MVFSFTEIIEHVSFISSSHTCVWEAVRNVIEKGGKECFEMEQYSTVRNMKVHLTSEYTDQLGVANAVLHICTWTDFSLLFVMDWF